MGSVLTLRQKCILFSASQVLSAVALALCACLLISEDSISASLVYLGAQYFGLMFFETCRKRTRPHSRCRPGGSSSDQSLCAWRWYSVAQISAPPARAQAWVACHFPPLVAIPPWSALRIRISCLSVFLQGLWLDRRVWLSEAHRRRPDGLKWRVSWSHCRPWVVCATLRVRCHHFCCDVSWSSFSLLLRPWPTYHNGQQLLVEWPARWCAVLGRDIVAKGPINGWRSWHPSAWDDERLVSTWRPCAARATETGFVGRICSPFNEAANCDQPAGRCPLRRILTCLCSH